MIRKFIRIPIYNRNVVIYIGETTAEAIQAVEKDYEITEREYQYTLGRMLVIDNKKKNTEHIVIMLGKDVENATVAHECLHAAYYIIDAIGQTIDEENHEVLAYLMSYLIREVDKIINKYGSTTTKDNEKLK